MRVADKPANREIMKTTMCTLMLSVCWGMQAMRCGGAISATSEIELHGNAFGGELILAVWNRPAWVSVSTSPGESSESVLVKLSEKINATDPFSWWTYRSRGRWTKEENGVKVMGDVLSRLGLGLTFAGTETGFNIPPPPLFVSASYEASEGRLRVRWEKSPIAIDAVQCSGLMLPPSAKEAVLELPGPLTEPRRVQVVFWRGKTPSNAGVVEIGPGSQTDIGGNPFSGGVKPNWISWAKHDDLSGLEFSSGVRGGPPTNTTTRFLMQPTEMAPFYQIIKCRKVGHEGGIYRKFLGLQPGHTYRVSARLRSLEAEPNGERWSYSVHASHDDSSSSRLSVRQLSGFDRLPDGSSGVLAGRIARYGAEQTTKGSWIVVSTQSEETESGIRDITLPPGCTSITVWLKLSGLNSVGVNLDWVRLDDVTRRD